MIVSSITTTARFQHLSTGPVFLLASLSNYLFKSDTLRTIPDTLGFALRHSEGTGRDLAITPIIMETFLNSIYTNRRTRFDKHTLFCTLRQANNSVTCLRIIGMTTSGLRPELSHRYEYLWAAPGI